MLSRPRLSEHFAGVAMHDGLVVLEPEKWVGKQFPLFNEIDTDGNLSTGSWIIVLYHHDCSKCRAVLPLYRRLPPQDGGQIVLVEVPPFDEREIQPSTILQYARLNADKEWFVSTPAEILLRNGTVIEVRTGNDVLAEFDRRRLDLSGSID
jgi:hypothetical protein